MEYKFYEKNFNIYKIYPRVLNRVGYPTLYLIHGDFSFKKRRKYASVRV